MQLIKQVETFSAIQLAHVDKFVKISLVPQAKSFFHEIFFFLLVFSCKLRRCSVQEVLRYLCIVFFLLFFLIFPLNPSIFFCFKLVKTFVVKELVVKATTNLVLPAFHGLLLLWRKFDLSFGVDLLCCVGISQVVHDSWLLSRTNVDESSKLILSITDLLFVDHLPIYLVDAGPVVVIISSE